jgi:hypothetical protein
MEWIIDNQQGLINAVNNVADLLKAKVSMKRADAQLILDMIDESKSCRNTVKSQEKLAEIISKL